MLLRLVLLRLRLQLELMLVLVLVLVLLLLLLLLLAGNVLLSLPNQGCQACCATKRSQTTAHCRWGAICGGRCLLLLLLLLLLLRLLRSRGLRAGQHAGQLRTQLGGLLLVGVLLRGRLLRLLLQPGKELLQAVGIHAAQQTCQPRNTRQCS